MINEAKSINISREVTNLTLFDSIGEPIKVSSVVQPDSLVKAVNMASSDLWQGHLTDASNMIRGSLIESGYTRETKKWNSICEQVHTISGAHVRDCMYDKLKEYSSDRLIINTMLIIIGACIEDYYKEWAPLGYFSSLLEWIRRGHLPCGAVSDYPSSQFYIY